MRRYIIFLFILIFGFSSCAAQDKDKKKNKEGTNPNTNVIVNKEYDEDGNLIRYDSTYSYFYSNNNMDTLFIDSLYKEFRNQFNQQYFFSEDPFFKDFFFTDSLLEYDFFKDDFFENRFRFNQGRMDKLFRDMDSIKNYFFREQIPDSLSIR